MSPLKMKYLLTLPMIVSVSSIAYAGGTIWGGPSIEFTKAGFADPTQPANQDRLTDNVWLTRGSSAGIYNARFETSYDRPGSPDSVSPLGTEWAFGTTDDLGSLVFDTWINTVGLRQAPFAVDRPMVVHLVDDDIYLDLMFTEFGGLPQGASFTYVRSTPIPEPTSAALAASVAGIVILLRRRLG